VEENEPGALGRRYDGDGHHVGGERRPRLILQLRYVTAEVRLDLARLVRRHDQVIAFDPATDPEAGGTNQPGSKVLDARALDADLRSRHRSETDERAHLDVVRPDPMRSAANALPTVNGHGVCSDPIDVRAEGAEEVREVLDVRLAGGIAKDGRSS